jgi:receptor expression-enhancing protein 1/2/3/4
MYWTTLSLFLLVENQLYFILSWVPFYSWIRLGIHLYLVLPGKQGSVFIYKEYIHPFLEEHERQIDQMISEGHAKAKAAGMDAVKKGVEYVRVNILGQEPRRPTPPPSRNVSYSTYLFNRFAMPSAREGLAVAGTSDLFSLLGKAMQQTTYPSSEFREEQARDLASSGTLIPPTLSGEERESFISTQRERLRTLLQAFDAEAFNADLGATSSAQPRSSMPRQPSSRKSYLAPQDGPGYMHKSRSEFEFEDLGYEAMPDPEQFRVYDNEDERPVPQKKPSTSGESAGWSNWIWGSYGEKDSAINVPKKEL